jgi:hypothetical protein
MPMMRRADAKWRGRGRLLLVVLGFLFFFLVFIFRKIAVLARFLFFLFFIIVIEVVGNKIQMDGMRLRDFELGLAFRAAKDFAFFYFIFVNINFGGTFRAADHGSILR